MGGDKFDLIFIDADKENYIEYYELSLKLLEKNGFILADNSLCALLYDQDFDVRSMKLHEFNQYVKNDKRTEQVVLTVREGITMIKPSSEPSIATIRTVCPFNEQINYRVSRG